MRTCLFCILALSIFVFSVPSAPVLSDATSGSVQAQTADQQEARGEAQQQPPGVLDILLTPIKLP